MLQLFTKHEARLMQR